MAYVFGNNGSNVLLGFNGSNDTIFGYAGPDKLYGLGGNDWLFGHEGWDSLYGGAGNDYLYGGSGGDLLAGGAGADYLNGGTGGGDTADYRDSPTGVLVSLQIGQGFFGDAQGDTLVEIEDVIGSSYDDILFGNDGDNKLYGEAGDDALWGNGGQDILTGGAGGDELNGGSGRDMASYADSSTGVWVILEAGTGYFGDAQGDSLVSIENLKGSYYNDRLYGDSQQNHLYGEAGNDVIKGGGGKDLLFGGGGDDEIEGGGGKDFILGGPGFDTLTGGGGPDTFQFNTDDAYPLDRYSTGNPEAFGIITDFNQAQGDKIRMAGAADLAFIGKSAFSGQGDELRYEKASGDTWIEGDLNGDKDADFVIQLAGKYDLTVNDFEL